MVKSKTPCPLSVACNIPDKVGRCIPICPFYNDKRGALRVRKMILECVKIFNVDKAEELFQKIYNSPIYVELFGERAETHFAITGEWKGGLIIFITKSMYENLRKTYESSEWDSMETNVSGNRLTIRFISASGNDFDIVIEGDPAFLRIIELAMDYLHIGLGYCENGSCNYAIINGDKRFDYREVLKKTYGKEEDKEFFCNSEDPEDLHNCVMLFIIANLVGYHIDRCLLEKLKSIPSLEKKYKKALELEIDLMKPIFEEYRNEMERGDFV